jgi:hypothetical protein
MLLVGACHTATSEALAIVFTCFAISRYRQSPFAHRICSGVLQSGSKSAGLATTMTAPRARLVATLKRCGS